MEKKIIQGFEKFCPTCNKKTTFQENQQIKKIVRDKAKELASKYNLEELIKEKEYKILDLLKKFKNLEDSCVFCLSCNWSPFESKISDNLLKNSDKNPNGLYLEDAIEKGEGQIKREVYEMLIKEKKSE